ncbi:hypothetical protein SAMN05444146_5200 [Flavobacterium johnsoniae]|nr:hypothetical protein SAMN05444146_5200 [Flavobacterium johnsoniae]
MIDGQTTFTKEIALCKIFDHAITIISYSKFRRTFEFLYTTFFEILFISISRDVTSSIFHAKFIKILVEYNYTLDTIYIPKKFRISLGVESFYFRILDI